MASQDFVITVARNGDHLLHKPPVSRTSKIFAEDDRHFFYKVVDAQITFEVDATGRATSLVLHQNGANVPGKRIE